ncbi:MAG TPA: DUF2723 domain-containing protein [Patescibacteria group bacterium]|nr:DUF2723 domain-containing protein [Patescibacteria group bacterium]
MIATLLGFISVALFLLFQSQGIPAGDSGDIVTAASTFGVAHPPGYPFYTFLGWLTSRIPVFTVSWRVGLLSSVPHAVVIAIVYVLVVRMTRSRIAGIFASLLILGNYLFFLYSITPEVFALLDAFVVVLLLLLIRWQESGRLQTFYLLSFIGGLSLTHHQVILFLTPAIAYFLWLERKHLKRISVLWVALFFISGLLPYLYIFLATHGHSMIIWDSATSITNVIKLVTRADYGTFQSSGAYGQLPFQRFLELQAFVQYLFEDFKWFGLGFMVVGFVSLWQKNRHVFWLFILSLAGMGPVFLFYASFPLISHFTLGTFERFLLPSYVIIAIGAGIGFSFVVDHIVSLTRTYRFHTILTNGFICLCFMFTFTLLTITLLKFTGYANDRTAENLGHDVLADLPYGSVLLLDRDTVLFTTQYVRYVEHFRSDIVVLHGSRLTYGDYQQIVHRNYPSLPMPPLASPSFLPEFLILNAAKTRLFSYTKYSIGSSWYWVPYGIVYELVSKDRLPSTQVMRDTNVRFWKTAHNPTAGILSRYNHLMLSDVRNVYEAARISFGETLLRGGDFMTAKGQFIAALAYGGDSDTATALKDKGISELELKECQNAIQSFEEAKKVSFTQDKQIIFDEATTYRDCLKDKGSAKKLFDEYATLVKNEQTPLQ